MEPRDRQQDSYRYDPETVAAFAEQFTMEPVAPGTIDNRIRDGQLLETTDVPEYLGRAVASDADTSIALYRLVQLFGTPNVPGLEAGADQPMREKTTWQYLFRAVYDPGDGEDAVVASTGRREHLLSVYDYRTNLSVGFSAFRDPPETPSRPVPEPSGDPPASGSVPGEEYLEVLVQLVLSTVEHAVEATYEDLRV